VTLLGVLAFALHVLNLAALFPFKGFLRGVLFLASVPIRLCAAASYTATRGPVFFLMARSAHVKNPLLVPGCVGSLKPDDYLPVIRGYA
jgi:hypothetical protein